MLKYLDSSQATKSAENQALTLESVEKSSRFKGKAFTFALVGASLVVASHSSASPLPSHVSNLGRVGEIFDIMPINENKTSNKSNKVISGHYEGESFSIDFQTDIVEGHRIEAIYSDEFDYEINFDEEYQYSPSYPSYRMVIDS